MCDSCLFLKHFLLPNTFSFIYELLINPLVKKIENPWIYHPSWGNISLPDMHSLQCMPWKNQKLDESPGHYQFTLQTKLGFSPAIMLQGIVIVHLPPVSVMIRNNFRILELDYLPIHYPSILLLDLRHSQTQKGLHHHNIVIKLLLKYILNSFWYHSALRHPTSPIFSDMN